MEIHIANASIPKSSQSNSTYCNNSAVTNNDSVYSELFTGKSFLELCNSFWLRAPNAKKDVQPYLRGCKWSPDGTCCLSVVNHDGIHIMELPRDLYEACPDSDRKVTLLPAVIHVKESGLVYDFCWYPKMNSHYPETCGWLTTKINSPIQMWDAYDGSLRCSYRGFNAVDEMEPAISVTFINQGQRIVGGYKNCLRTFDVERPGREYLEHKTKSPASCFATHGNMLAVGSWNANINLFSILDNGTYRSMGNLNAHTGGITHLQFTPNGMKLVSGARKDHNLCVWDIRYHRRPLNILKRCVNTNQRIYFDISSCGRYLVSGGTDGEIRVWDDKVTKWTEQFNVNDSNRENATFRFQLYRDCCNSVSIHPSRPILATGSGQFHFFDPVKILESQRDDIENCKDNTQMFNTDSSSNKSSSDDEISVKSPNIDLTREKEFPLRASNINKGTSSTDGANVLTEEFPYEIPNKDVAEVSPPKVISHESRSESPPVKKAKWSNDINISSDKEIINKKSPESVRIFETLSNVECIDEEPLSNENKLVCAKACKDACNIVETSIEENNGRCELKISTIDKEAVDSPSNEDSDLVNKELLDKQSLSKLIIKDNIDIQSLRKIDEVDMVSNKDHYKPDGEENCTKLEANLKDINTVYKSTHVLKSDSNIQSSLKLTQSKQTAVSPMKAPYLEKLSDNNNQILLDDNMGSDDDFNDDIEYEMKYSENNLTFWWIA